VTRLSQKLLVALLKTATRLLRPLALRVRRYRETRHGYAHSPLGRRRSPEQPRPSGFVPESGSPARRRRRKEEEDV
jgi:hypothetical protein